MKLEKYKELLREKINSDEVFNIINKALDDYKIFNIDENIMVKQGIRGLIDALEIYDESSDIPFSIILNQKIRLRLKFEIKKYHETYPMHLIDTIAKYIKYITSNEIDIKNINNSYIASILHLSEEKIEIIRNIVDNESSIITTIKNNSLNTNVIFLDIDGVLNTSGDTNLKGDMFEIKKFKNVCNLSCDTLSKIVIISDRRLYEKERNVITNMFHDYGISIDYLSVKRTHRKRSDEIKYYLSNNKDINKYVILDDVDLGYSEDDILSKYFVNTEANGFDEAKYNEALKILKDGE